MDNSIRRSVFWKIIQEELPRFGFKEYDAEFKGGSSNIVIIKGINPITKQETQQKYPFPRICRSFESHRNFRTAFRNFIRYELPDRNCYAPDDHRVRQPGSRIAHINHDVPKKQLAPPKSLLQLVGELKPALHEVLAPPTIPEEPPKLNKAGEPVSSNMILATFIVNISDLSSITEACEGTAKFFRYRPCPMRLLDAAQQQPVIPATPVPAVVPNPVQPPPAAIVPPPPVSAAEEITGSKSYDPKTKKWTPIFTNIQDIIVYRMRADKKREWSAGDFADLSKSTNSLNASLSVLNASKRIKRVGFGKYKAK